MFAGGEKTYNLLNEQLEALKQADSNYDALLRNKPQKSDYQESYTKKDGTTGYNTSRRYDRVYDNWESKKNQMEQQCTSMIENIDAYIAVLKQINGAGLDGVSINFGGLPGVIGFENIQFNYNPTPIQEAMDYQLEYLSEDEARNLGYAGQKVGKVMINDIPLYFLTDEVGEDFIQSITSTFENIPSGVLKYANWNDVVFGKDNFSIWTGTDTFTCEFESDDYFKQVTEKLAERVSLNCNNDRVINDQEDFAKEFAEYLRNPELRETYYKSIDDLVTNNFEVQEKVIRDNSDIVADYRMNTKEWLPDDSSTTTTEIAIERTEELVGKILDNNGKKYTSTTYAIEEGASPASLYEKVTSAGGVVVVNIVNNGPSVVYQTENNKNGYAIFNPATGNFFNDTETAGLKDIPDAPLEFINDKFCTTVTVYTDQDLSDIPGLTKI